MNWLEFKRSICNLQDKRNHRVTNSLGVYNAYKWIRKNKWLDLPRPVTEHEFYSIIRKVNNYFADNLVSGYDIKFPHKMGRLELRKFEASIKMVNGKIVTNLPIDWDRTLKLWYEDEDAYKERVLIKVEEKEIFRVFYNRTKANFNNKTFYEWHPNRDLSRRLKEKIKEGTLDAFKL